MVGLVGYSSSEEDEEIEEKEVFEVRPKRADAPAATPGEKVNSRSLTATGDSALKEDTVVIGPVQQNAVPLGPSLPPVGEPMINEENILGQTPSSPYSANRALLRDLTLPSAPNMDIPPSPPGSPQPGANKKIEQFLDLKKKGIHFNAKLEQSSALKNPGLMDKLMAFAEIDDGGQYSTTLPTDLWDPNGFPDWAFKDKLRRSVEKLAKEKELEKASNVRTTVDFVPSTAPGGGSTSGAGGLSRGEKRKGGWK
ncbi:HCNGP-like protein-domain-containing protein [Dactylonectria estremocensis]|uniref:HCNGP-like protein-domain-containing protein n=1 Tax=Dactylonectria estremocensis TaxID=1079267 RepID=A0A9P9FIE1_9HYPO|nr:HCNGP-like protein-domain-containing protein [Dactylonectria estremocensis]